MLFGVANNRQNKSVTVITLRYVNVSWVCEVKGCKFSGTTRTMRENCFKCEAAERGCEAAHKIALVKQRCMMNFGEKIKILFCNYRIRATCSSNIKVLNIAAIIPQNLTCNSVKCRVPLRQMTCNGKRVIGL